MSEHIMIDAKNMATDKLIDILTPHILSGLKTMYKQASELNRKEPIKMFQVSLNRIPVLPTSMIKTDYMYLINEGKCDERELSKLIESLFICHVKLGLISQGLDINTPISLDDLEIPSNMNFVHQCYINAARALYPAAHLFSHKYNAEQQAQNGEFICQKISGAINRTIRDLIPFSVIYSKYIERNVRSGPLPPHEDQKGGAGGVTQMGNNFTLKN